MNISICGDRKDWLKMQVSFFRILSERHSINPRNKGTFKPSEICLMLLAGSNFGDLKIMNNSIYV